MMANPLSRGVRTFATLSQMAWVPRPLSATLASRSLNEFRRCRWISTSHSAFASAAVENHKPTAAVPEVATRSTNEHEQQGKPFTDLQGQISNETLQAITQKPLSMTHMTAVQEAVFDLLPELAEPYESGKKSDGPRDLMVKARTGTGKTLSFLVPVIEARVKAREAAIEKARKEAGSSFTSGMERRALREFTRNNVGALILSPTRELATQIATEAMQLTRLHENMEVHLLVGGLSKIKQIRDWEKGVPDIVVATTGRMRDLMDSHSGIKSAIQKTRVLVLDEADTMLDMGFRDDIDAISNVLPSPPFRQTFFFSATINSAVQQVAKQIMGTDHEYINTVPEDASPVHAHIPQYHTVLSSASEQIPHMLRLIAHDQLTNPGKSKVILFFQTTKMTQLFATFIRELSKAVLPAGKGTAVYELHSKLAMPRRTSTSRAFRMSKSGADILVTSDVSARGVDYPGVTRVIQVGVPVSTEQYIHRVGRTGRKNGSAGRGDLILSPWETNFLSWKLRGIPMRPVTVEKLEKEVMELSEKHDSDPKEFYAGAGMNKYTQYLSGFSAPIVPRLQDVEKEVTELLSMVEEEAIEETFVSLLGFYSTHGQDVGSKSNLLDGCRQWAVDACGLQQPPSLSNSILFKLGYTDEDGAARTPRRSNFGLKKRDSGRSFSGRPSTEYSPQNARRRPHWESRGNVNSRTKDNDRFSQGRGYGRSSFGMRGR